MHSSDNHLLSFHQLLGTEDIRQENKKRKKQTQSLLLCSWDFSRKINVNQITKNKCETAALTLI